MVVGLLAVAGVSLNPGKHFGVDGGGWLQADVTGGSTSDNCHGLFLLRTPLSGVEATGVEAREYYIQL
jgi:hypothetical protein